MSIKKKLFWIYLLVLTLTVTGLSSFIAPTAKAFSIPELIENIKDIFTQDPPKGLTLDSKIKLAPEGDIDQNGEIDSGDTITFTYTINNQTDQEYPFSILKTSIPRDSLHFIHNIRGTASLSDKNKTIEIPNLRINPHQVLIISFNARINYFTDNDEIIGTEPEIVSKDKSSIFKAKKEEIKAQPWKGVDLPSIVNVRKK